jgi:hypothetical protein
MKLRYCVNLENCFREKGKRKGVISNNRQTASHTETIRMKTLITLVVLLLAEFARAGLVTMTAQATSSTNWGTNEIVLGPYEAAELVSFPVYAASFGSLHIIKDGRTLFHRPLSYGNPTAPFDPVVVAGPATLRLICSDSSNPALCTFRIMPEAYPPDRALLVPPGTNQVQVTLECSTNLVNWFAATNGVYGPLPEAKFFRINTTRLQ